jgi:riboflavin kinase
MIDPIIFNFLKNISIRNNAGKMVVNTSSLSRELKISQQSASRYLIILEREGYISRKRIKNGEEIVLTEKAYDEFKKELKTMEYILNSSNEIKIEGILFSGLGEGSYYMSRNGYVTKIKEFLNFIPFAGTLNLRLTDDSTSFNYVVNNLPGYSVDPFEEDGRKFGAIKVLRAKMLGEEVGIVLPERTHYERVVEIVSPSNLRKKFNLNDGDKLQVSILKEK